MVLVEVLKPIKSVGGQSHDRGEIVDASAWGKALQSMVRIGQVRYYVPPEMLTQHAPAAAAGKTGGTDGGRAKAR